MKVSCDIIKDLLPLYAEGMTSQASNEMVDEHLCQCDACTKELGVLKKAPKVPVEVDTSALKRVGDTIRRRRVLAVLTAVLFIATVLLGGALLLDARIYMDAENVVEFAKQLEDGAVYVQFNNLPVGVGGLANDEETVNHGVIAWTNLRKILFYSKKRPSYEETDPQFRTLVTKEQYEEMGGAHIQLGDGAEQFNVWYVNAADGRADTLLLDGGEEAPEKPLVDVNYHLAYYCAALAILALLLVIPARWFRDKWYGEICARFAIVCVSVCLSTIIVCAGQFVEVFDEFTESVTDGLMLSVPMALTALLAHRLYKLNKQDKGL